MRCAARRTLWLRLTARSRSLTIISVRWSPPVPPAPLPPAAPLPTTQRRISKTGSQKGTHLCACIEDSTRQPRLFQAGLSFAENGRRSECTRFFTVSHPRHTMGLRPETTVLNLHIGGISLWDAVTVADAVGAVMAACGSSFSSSSCSAAAVAAAAAAVAAATTAAAAAETQFSEKWPPPNGGGHRLCIVLQSSEFSPLRGVMR